mmetsp:Transcript_6550/g.16059  ORF Transcript_6550/g.16059 Transcript_6550/m.16059 type:complete len:210 (+) Transcript_6550:362-991(+)
MLRGAPSSVEWGPHRMQARPKPSPRRHGDVLLELTSASRSTPEQIHASATSRSPTSLIHPRRDCQQLVEAFAAVDLAHQDCRSRPWPWLPEFDPPPAAQAPQDPLHRLRLRLRVHVDDRQPLLPHPAPDASSHYCAPSQKKFARRRPHATSTACQGFPAAPRLLHASKTCANSRWYLRFGHVLHRDPCARTRNVYLHWTLPYSAARVFC